MRFVLVLAAALAATAVVAGGASADPKARCEITPFTFGDAIVVDVDFGPNRSRIEWEATGSTALACPGRPLMGIDVWEHAYGIFGERENGKPVWFLRGRAEIEIEFPGADITVPLEGSIRGRRPSDDVIDTIVTARSPGGARVELRQTGTLDLGLLSLDLEVNDGFFDIFTEWLD